MAAEVVSDLSPEGYRMLKAFLEKHNEGMLRLMASDNVRLWENLPS